MRVSRTDGGLSVKNELELDVELLNLVRTGLANTRPALGRATGLGRTAVAARVDRAIARGLLEEIEPLPSSGGRAPRRLRFRSEQGWLLVCAIGGSHIRVGLSDLDGEIIAHAHLEWDVSVGPDRTLERVFALAFEVLGHGQSRKPLWGVAVGLPGPVDFAAGRLVSPPTMPGWNGFDVRRAFESEFGAPTWVDNDANLLALAERPMSSSDAATLIYCKVGTGIGAGIVTRGELHRGANGAAGNIGHIRVVGSALECRCGAVGCLEAVAGGWALVRDAGSAMERGESGLLTERMRAGAPPTPELIAVAADDGDPLALELLRTSARAVGVALAGVANVINPDIIVIGGVVAGADQVYLAEVRRGIYEFAPPLLTQDLTIRRSENDPRVPLRGAIELLIEELFDTTISSWLPFGAPALGR